MLNARHVSINRKPYFSAAIAFILSLCLASIGNAAGANDPANAPFGSYEKPFAATSYWNATPVNPVLGNSVVPESLYKPVVGESNYATGVFLAKSTDGPMVVTSSDGGPWDPDTQTKHDVIIPHWPADTLPASGGDGHADIIDPITGIVHSFWLLSKNPAGKWVAVQYAWTRLDGSGWPDPAHYFQGARAAGVATAAGLIRTWEFNSSLPYFHHALAMSLTNNGLAANPAFVFPATSADNTAATTNNGAIPEGALLMLPASFNAQALGTPELRRVAETLKRYGAYVVDRNYGTPYQIYAEIGSGFRLHKNGWDNVAAADLEKIRAALRPLVSSDGWLDGNGNPFTPDTNLNLLSMRGYWIPKTSTTVGKFDSWKQAVVFPASPAKMVQYNNGNRGLVIPYWAVPAIGAKMRASSVTTGGGKFRMRVSDKNGKPLFDTSDMDNGKYFDFAWPASGAIFELYATSGGLNEVSTVSGTIKKAP
ncbi:MAG: hypothetical protein JWP38_804 [Herbaspirillum sp.]|nr:hypothetical protein [Herbaspirillum sp.]